MRINAKNLLVNVAIVLMAGVIGNAFKIPDLIFLPAIFCIGVCFGFWMPIVERK